MSGSDVMVYIDSERCDGCGRCVEMCPVEALYLEGGVAQIDQALCTGCEACMKVCPERAILSVRTSDAEAALPAMGPTTLPGTPRQSSRLTRWAPKLVPILGTALVYLAREVAPKVVAHLLSDAERHTPASPGTAGSTAEDAEASTTVSGERRAERGRFRHRGGQS
jgi:NAD-dependent dihydropyrimidine dehydrogenase PreA subunit